MTEEGARGGEKTLLTCQVVNKEASGGQRNPSVKKLRCWQLEVLLSGKSGFRDRGGIWVKRCEHLCSAVRWVPRDVNRAIPKETFFQPQHLMYHRCSMNISWMNEWTSEWVDPVLPVAFCPPCPENASCYNSTHCACKDGFHSTAGRRYVTESSEKCEGKEAIHTQLGVWKGSGASL